MSAESARAELTKRIARVLWAKAVREYDYDENDPQFREDADAIVYAILSDRDLVLSALGGEIAGWVDSGDETYPPHWYPIGARPMWVFPSPTSTGDEQ